MTEKKNTANSKKTQKKTASKAKTKVGKTSKARKTTNRTKATTSKKKATKKNEGSSPKYTSQEKKRFWDEALKNIATGADVVVDQVTDYKGQATGVMSKFWEQMKDLTSKAYKQSAEFIDEVAVSAYGYAKKYKDNIEISSLNKEKAKIGAKLGLMLHLESKNKDGLDIAGFMKRKDVIEFFKELDEIDKKIVTLGRKYDKS